MCVAAAAPAVRSAMLPSSSHHPDRPAVALPTMVPSHSTSEQVGLVWTANTRASVWQSTSYNCKALAPTTLAHGAVRVQHITVIGARLATRCDYSDCFDVLCCALPGAHAHAMSSKGAPNSRSAPVLPLSICLNPRRASSVPFPALRHTPLMCRGFSSRYRMSEWSTSLWT